MNKYFSLVALVVAAVATSCSTEDLPSGASQDSNGTTDVTLTASLATPKTRVGMIRNGSSASLYWHENDAISVLARNAAANTSSSEKFTTTAATGEATATFSGKINNGAEAVCAAYPYNENHALSSDGTTLTYRLPSAYTYSKVESEIFSTVASDRVNHADMPMFGIISEDNKVDFKHLGGMMVIRVDKMPITAGTLTVTSAKQLSGDFTFTLPTASETAAITTTDGTSANNTVTFTFSEAKEGSAGVFYLPLATGEYTDFEVTLSNSSDYNQTVSYGTQTITRASISAVSLVAQVKINDHWFVDLGLPSGLLWATTNVGADSPTDYGNYYAWGEITTKEEYTETNYTTPYSGYDPLPAANDAATQIWGTSCRMPTDAEFEELKDNTERAEATMNEIKGVKVTSKTNGNSIFLPHSGYHIGTEKGQQGEGFSLWSSQRASTRLAYSCGSNRGELGTYSNYWWNGYAIRPVSQPQSSVESNSLENTSISSSLDTSWE